MPLYAGLDIGTNGARLVVLDYMFTIKYQNELFYQTYSPAEGRAEQDPEEIYQATYNLLKEMLSLFPDEKIYITFSSVMHSIMGVNNKGDIMTPLIIWADTRASEECIFLEKNYGIAEFYRNTACPLHSAYCPAKICWLKKNVSEDIAKYVSIKEYILYRLTGLWKADYGIASTSGIYNPLINDYHNSILEILNIDRNSMSELVPTNYSFDFSINGKTLYGIIGSTDGPLANLGSGAVEEGSIVLTAGSSSAVRFISSDVILDDEAKVWNYVLDKDFYILGEATNGAGIILNWLAEVFEYTSAEDMISRNISSLPYDISNLFSLPTMMGERGPGYNESIRGLYYGLTLNHKRQDMVVSLYESIAFFLRMVLAYVTRILKRPGKQIILTGGLGTSPLFRELLSYLFDVPLFYLAGYEQSTALGAAMLARKEVENLNYDEQVKLLPDAKEIDIEKDDLFKKKLLDKYESFVRLYNNLPSIEDSLNGDFLIQVNERGD
ncbi:MAG: gluconokinase [Halanaerobiales bacterium]